jgi:hypothetical protein
MMSGMHTRTYSSPRHLQRVCRNDGLCDGFRDNQFGLCTTEKPFLLGLDFMTRRIWPRIDKVWSVLFRAMTSLARLNDGEAERFLLLDPCLQPSYSCDKALYEPFARSFGNR